MSKVWITRTLPAAMTTADKVKDMGFVPLVSPLLNVTRPEMMPPLPGDDCLLVFTSKNAVRAFCDQTENRHWSVITGGDATADLAKNLGFKAIKSASGTGLDVVELIKSKVKQSTPIIHCAGETIRVDMAETLSDEGYSVRRDIYYETVPVDTFSDEISGVTYVLFYSPLAALTLRNLNVDVSHMTSISISKPTDAALGALVLRERRIANAPTEAALLACLQG